MLLSPATPDTRTPIFVRLLRVPTYRWMEGLRRRMPGRSRRRAGEILVHLVFRQVLAPGHRPPKLWYESVLASLGREGALLDLETVAREVLMVLRGDVPEIHGLLEGVGDVDVPVAVLRGEEDPVVGEPELRELARRLPAGRYVPLEGVGHCPQNESPERIAEVVLSVL